MIGILKKILLNLLLLIGLVNPKKYLLENAKLEKLMIIN
jgi:hypothetical protein